MKNEKIPTYNQHQQYYSMIKKIVKNEYYSVVDSGLFEINYFDNLIDIDEDAQHAVDYLSKIKNCDWNKARDLVVGDCVWKMDDLAYNDIFQSDLPPANQEKIKLIEENLKEEDYDMQLVKKE